MLHDIGSTSYLGFFYVRRALCVCASMHVCTRVYVCTHVHTLSVRMFTAWWIKNTIHKTQHLVNATNTSFLCDLNSPSSTNAGWWTIALSNSNDSYHVSEVIIIGTDASTSVLRAWLVNQQKYKTMVKYLFTVTIDVNGCIPLSQT